MRSNKRRGVRGGLHPPYWCWPLLKLQWAKVFWFFSSEKNGFLSYDTTLLGPRYELISG
jgi:hypothetical protein